MLRGARQTLRYASRWKSGCAAECSETSIDRDGSILPATFAQPPGHRGPLPAWIVLGGVTSMGRFHPQLSRFTNALALSGAAVLVPEIPEWRDLHLAPAVAIPTVRAAVRALDLRLGNPEVRYGLVGFSFGAPQAVVASTDPTLSGRISSVMSFGGYCDLERTLRCQLTGLHEWEGETHRIDPDPYGRWVLASNYLTAVDGYTDAHDVADALRRLALASTERRIAAWDCSHEPLKQSLRAGLAPGRREVFDLFAPALDEPVGSSQRSEAMTVALAAACRRSEQLLDPVPRLRGASVPVHLIHGRGDRLVPYTESLRLHELLPSHQSRVTITSLFAHSAGNRPTRLADRISEGWIFFRGLQAALESVR